MAADKRILVRDLALDDQDGTPLLVVVNDYLEREALATAITEEAEIYRITCERFSDPQVAAERLPLLRADQDQAAILLIDADQVGAWVPVLESVRESLPDWTRFVIVFIMPSDLPALASGARSFWSWVKNRVYTDLAARPASQPVDELALEMERMRAETHLSPEEYIDAWRSGRISDTFEHSVWLNIARGMVEKSRS